MHGVMFVWGAVTGIAGIAFLGWVAVLLSEMKR
jgi:hypothetical protein